MKILTVRLTDDLHHTALRAAGTDSLTSFIREAISEKAARAQLADEMQELRQEINDQRERIDRLERLLERLLSAHQP